ncbi:MAG: chloride channel protein [Sphaerochaetaceae bacterium]|nr:chloride channel protein [Sphaerochaetaceae bacterium]
MDTKIEQLLNNEKRAYNFFLRSLIVGLFTGAVITLYANLISFATTTNKNHPFLILFIPLGAVITYYLFKICSPKSKNITDDAIKSINNSDIPLDQLPETINPVVGLITLVGTFLTHLFGAAGGKEGAGVQIGFASAALIKKGETLVLKKEVKDSDYYLMCGAAAAFGALFHAPVAGLFFGTQFASPTKTRLDLYLPCTIASFSAVLTSKALGIHMLEMPSVMALSFDFKNFLIVIAFALLMGYLSRFFSFGIHLTKNIFGKLFKKSFTKKVMASVVLMLLSFALYYVNGDFRYNGLGTDLIIANIQGTAQYWDFAIKFVFVALTCTAAFLGGEVVPILIFGSGAGFVFAQIFSLNVPAFATLGALAVFSGCTNLPLVAFALGLEYFGYSDVMTLVLATAVAFVSSGIHSIYGSQPNPYKSNYAN